MHLRALAAQRDEHRELALWTAWHAAAFSRCETLPDFSELRRRVRGEEQSPEEQMRAAAAIAAAFGGAD